MKVVVKGFIALGVATLSVALENPSVSGFDRDSTSEVDPDGGVFIPEHIGSKGDAPAWSYNDPLTGPTVWARSNPSCGGKRQSPIDIQLNNVQYNPDAHELQPLLFNYRWMDAQSLKSPRVALTLQNSGAGPVFMATSGSNFQSKQHAHIYQLNHIAFRSPSEHAINGKRFAMEAQLYHRSRQSGKVSIVSVLFNLGAENAFLNTLNFDFLPKAGKSTNVYGQINPLGIFPFNQHYYTYDGSLTEPPCTEGVTWYVLHQPVECSAKQLDRLQTALKFATNARPVQPLGPRSVFASTKNPLPTPLPLSFLEVEADVQAPLNATIVSTTDVAPAAGAKLTPVVVSDQGQLKKAIILCNGSPCPPKPQCGCNICPCATNCGCTLCPCQDDLTFERPTFRDELPKPPTPPDTRLEAVECGDSPGQPPCPQNQLRLRYHNGFQGSNPAKGSVPWAGKDWVEADSLVGAPLFQNRSFAPVGPIGKLNATAHLIPELKNGPAYVAPELKPLPPVPCECGLACPCAGNGKIFFSRQSVRSVQHPDGSSTHVHLVSHTHTSVITPALIEEDSATATLERLKSRN